MPNSSYTAIMLLIDRSGSMEAIRVSAEDAINELINDHRTASDKRPTEKVTIRIAKFDNEYKLVCPSTDPDHIPDFTLSPRNTTALLDAMARSITEFRDELTSLVEDQRPKTVIYAVMTDGKENASIEADWETVKQIVTRQQEEFGWHVLYLGANQDAFEIGARLNVPSHSTMSYAATDHGTRAATQTVGAYIVQAATEQTAAFTTEQRHDAMQ